ncbi:MAG: CvpA family protein [Bacteroidales bacterium]|nr:CvpA family protein [Bacteroidales bacterium]MDD4669912.1 CvpA family protein [Bacteroidales bacterium]
MGIIDLIIIICFLPAIYFGIKNGLIKQLISLAVIFGGIWLSIRFADVVSKWIVKYVTISDTWAKIISFAIIFTCVAIILDLLEKLLTKIIKITLLGWLNRLLGVVLTFGIFALVLSVVVYFVDSLNNLLEFIPAEKMDESTFYPFLLNFANTLFPYLKSIF